MNPYFRGPWYQPTLAETNHVLNDIIPSIRENLQRIKSEQTTYDAGKEDSRLEANEESKEGRA